MCNLYDIGRPRNKSRSEWEDAVAEILKKESKIFGIRKTDPGIVVAADESPFAQIMRWGFHRPFNPAINNARSDKLDGMWKNSWKERRRCLIPIQTFYEWRGPTGQKQTFAFEAPDRSQILWAAGVWEPKSARDDGPDLPSYSMLTTEASPAVAAVHHRMPVLLFPDQFEEFLLAENPSPLLQPFPGELDIYRCDNPLKDPERHEGPRKQEMLPGFDDLG